MDLIFNNATTFFFNGKQYFAVETEEKEKIGMFLNNKKNIPYVLETKEYRKKRSLNANSYAWVLINNIAGILNTEKDEVYFELLKKYGQCGVVKVKDKDIDKFKMTWKYNEEMPNLKEDNCTFLKFWVGSSNYNTKEMSDFINGIVEDAKELGIETMTPDEIARLEGIYDEANKSVTNKQEG